MPDEPIVITPASEPEFSLESYRAEREGPPQPPAKEAEKAPAKEPSAEPEKVPETASDSETEGDKQEQQPDEQPAKGKGGFQRRIDKLVAKNAELERQLADKSAVQPRPAQAPAVEAEGEPKLESFTDYDAYTRALARWEARQEWKAIEAEQAKAKAEAAAAAQQAEFSTKLEAARAKYDDFDEVISADLPITAVTRDFLLDSAVGTDLMYQLGSDPAEALRISKLSPIAQIKALTALEAKLAPPAPEAPKPKATTRAPEPIKPVGTSAAPVLAYKPEMDYEEFKRWRQTGGGR